MTKARTRAAKRRERKAQQAASDMDIAPVKRRAAQGRERMAQIEADRPAMIARARQMGIDLAKPADVATRAGREAARDTLREQLRDLRAPWIGCNAGRAMASIVKADTDRQDMWTAIQHMRRVQAAYDRSIGAPNRHAQCLRLLAPVDAMEADATSPPLDTRSDEERARQAVAAWMQVQGWLDHAKDAAGMCKRVVIDDETCRDASAMVRALHCVVDGIKGRKIVCRPA